MSITHNHTPRNYSKAFAIGITLNIIFVIIELGYGLAYDSMALISDASHNFSDVLGLMLAWGAAYLMTKKPTLNRSYGFRRVTIMASLVSSVLLFIGMGAILWESIARIGIPQPVSGVSILVVSGIGFVINGITAFMFYSGKDSDLNIKGAYLHMLGDAGVSLGVVVAGITIIFTGWFWLDPVISIIIAIIIIISTWDLMQDSLNLIIDTVPSDVDPAGVRNFLRNLPEVKDLHDLHIWAMSTTENALTVHLVTYGLSDNDRFLMYVSDELSKRFGIHHSTIQIEKEFSEEACRQKHPDTV